jgi:pyruvate formate lyase activating enzyme
MVTLFSAVGCVRCRIAAAFMDACGVSYEKSDVHGQGKAFFKRFYRENRSAVTRGPDGIAFPILFTGDKVIQGLGPVLAFLQAGTALDPFVTLDHSPQGWISGLDLSARFLPDGSNLLAVIRFLKQKGLNVQVDTCGRNPHILESVIAERLCDKVVFTLHGPASRYRDLTGLNLDESDLLKSLSLLTSVKEYTLLLPVEPVSTSQGPGMSITPEEAALAAELVEKATGSKKHPFFIQPLAPRKDTRLPPLTSPEMFKYRTLCRRFMVMADVWKPSE